MEPESKRSGRDEFPWVERPQVEQRDELWDAATFVIDTNVLLSLYRLDASSRDDLLDALERIRDRVWFPYQVRAEFYRNRERVIVEQQEDLKKIESKVWDSISAAKSALNARSHHSSVDLNALKAIVRTTESDVKKSLSTARRNRLRLDKDPIMRRVEKLFADRGMPKPDPGAIAAQTLEACNRYARLEPPGYLDDRKPESRKYGDYFIWRELVDLAAPGQTIAFVTNDVKEDWWLIEEDERIGPRSELLHELYTEKGAFLDFGQATDLLKYAKFHLGVEVSEASIETVKEDIAVTRERERIFPEPSWTFTQPADFSRFLRDGERAVQITFPAVEAASALMKQLADAAITFRALEQAGTSAQMQAAARLLDSVPTINERTIYEEGKRIAGPPSPRQPKGKKAAKREHAHQDDEAASTHDGAVEETSPPAGSEF